MRSTRRMHIWQKLALLGAVFALLFAVPTGLYLSQSAEALARTAREAEGLTRAELASNLLHAISRHRALASAFLGGLAAADAPRRDASAEVARAQRALSAALAPSGRAGRALGQAMQSWDGLEKGVAGKLLSARDAHARHTEVAQAILGVVDEILDEDGLATDADIAAHYLAVAAYVHAPAIAEAIGQARSLGMGLLASRQATQAERLEVATILERVKGRLADAAAALAKASQADAELGKRLAPALAKAEAQAQAALKNARVDVVFNQALEAGPLAHGEAQAAAVDAQWELSRAASADTRSRLDGRREGQRLRLALVVGVALAAFAAALLFGIWTSRSIARPIGHAVKVADGIAAGRLDHDIDPARGKNEEAGRLLASFAAMQGALSGLVGEIRAAAHEIDAAAGAVADGNAQLSARTENQAASLEETAATMEEFTSAVKRNAENARQAAGVVDEAASSVAQGTKAMDAVIGTMGEINGASGRIKDIVAAIDAIAFQTNILALNAAVEAARAGEQGRGFAVVASEVRNLAQRSAASAKEIRGLIENSVGRVEAGVRLVEQAGRTMDELVTSVRKVAEIMTEIASASHEQSSGIDQINKAITQMDHVVQMNASLVEEATAAATSMAHQATGLANAVAQFRVDEAAAQAAVAAVPSAESLMHRAVPASRPASPPAAVEQRREPALASPESDEWKEF